ncbi:hypothetical protein JQ604_25895 [Bradyrhizobium jicamae]|uniref:hypothetical protein n=1 Tax=Bradyrhizobium jicamae TaxID=280332 RepID=UPI001BA47F58|nr:hypothetical protein [Bradyrhizobium jicamae]MBR0755626.1 hypothetical protein [Bradyrhizobium jicamae]
MTALASYSTGTVSVSAGGTTVGGVGTIWSGVNARPGDILQIGNFQSVITDVTDTTHIVIPPWDGGNQSGVAYKIWKVSPQRFAGAQAMADVSTLVAALNTDGFFFFVALTATVPDPSLGNNNQYALQPSTGKLWLKSGGTWMFQGYAFTHLPRGYIAGLTLSTAGSSAAFSVAAGEAIDSTNLNLLLLAGSISKTTSAWAVGSGNGALDTGTIANATWYHVYLIERTDTGVVDVLLSTSASSPTLPASYTLFRRIGAMKTNGSAQWTKFVQDGDYFAWDAPVQDVNATNPGTSAVLSTLSVPPGINVLAKFRARTTVSTSATVCSTLYSDPAVTDAAPDFAGNGQQLSNTSLAPIVTLQVRTNTSAQIRIRCSFSDSGTNKTLMTEGWTAGRGKNG